MAKFRPIPPLTPKQIDRFWSRVDVPYQPSCCWEWQGYKHRDGYGCVRYERRMGAFQAHRVSYTLLLGPIPDGMTLDHLCRNRPCVNPDHLQIVDVGTNTLRGYGTAALNKRKTHCRNGHELVPDPYKEGHRRCPICIAANAKLRPKQDWRKYYYAKKAAVAAVLEDA
jgi:hypothetical protein